MSTAGRRADKALAIDVHAFRWDAARIATLRHSTLPWSDPFEQTIAIAAKRLLDVKEPGPRVALSLVGQFAAHQALLQFAGIADGAFAADEWAIAPRRGGDCRLVRVAARACTPVDSPPLLTLVEQFAEAIGAPPLETCRESWARAETVYAEVAASINGDIAADCAWLRRSASGEVLPPGPDVLAELTNGAASNGVCDRRVVDSLRAIAIIDGAVQVFAIGGGSVLQRYSALADFRRDVRDLDALSESEIVERLVPLAATCRVMLAVDDARALDAASARVVQLASTIEHITVVHTNDRPADRTFFIVSSRLAARDRMRERLKSCSDPEAWLRAFVDSPALVPFVASGELPPTDCAPVHLTEPRRSYVAALALLGESIPEATMRKYLEQLLYAGDLYELAVDGLSEMRDGDYRFVSTEARSRVISLVPAATHGALYRVAARAAHESGRLRDAARLLLAIGDAAAAVDILNRIAWTSSDDVVSSVAAVPLAALTASPPLARRYAGALIDSGRYRDARAVADLLPTFDRDVVLARADRRTGDYDAALQRLMPLAGSAEADVLRAEVLAIHRRNDEARAVLAACKPDRDDIRVQAGYELALLDANADLSWRSIEAPSRDYFVARLETYRAVEAGDAAVALDRVERSLASATTVAQRIDALLDRMYVLFTAGRWTEARSAALAGLTEAEETQGDRAAGGFLFVIAYLAADDGQWAHASQRIDRLRRFYSGRRDEHRLDELALLSAHLNFSRGHFDDAARESSALIDAPHDPQIREAAALIIDESNWILGRDAPLYSRGMVESVELTDRHRLMLTRRGRGPQTFRNPFIAAIAEWEAGGEEPVPATTTAKLMMFRSAAGRGDTATAEVLAHDAGIDMLRVTETPRTEQAVIRAIATAEFPFDERPLAGVAWRYVTRNRLRQWQQLGPLPALVQDDIERASEMSGDWIPVSDRELVFIDGVSRWTPDSRDAATALLRAKAEVHRLRRILDQEESGPAIAERASIAGIVGESSAIRDLLALVSRVARRDVPICILGESGTGKELVARAIHLQSARRGRPFTAINCAALPESLIESELFGHVRGAFTGADRDRAGVIESTDGGTLFLDEIGEMPLVAQAKLLRFLQDGEFRRVGDTSNRSADVRIVAATNRKLESAVEEGRFREDLYYRIRGLEAVLPPLRERGRDILLLASHFIAEEREKHRSGPVHLSAEAEAIFVAYNWPGNVRELQNTIRAAHAIAGETREIDVDHLPERLRRIVPPRATVSSYQEAVTRFRRDLIQKSLTEAMGNQNRAASMLNISRQALAYQIRELGIMVNKEKKTAKPL